MPAVLKVKKHDTSPFSITDGRGNLGNALRDVNSVSPASTLVSERANPTLQSVRLVESTAP